ncbi:MAG: hypothetical protein HQM00_00125 [Magnetococcales bacterium]|nr:hypothetical protein [Magnetococcales bacterium]
METTIDESDVRAKPVRNRASFRDPYGYVVEDAGRIFRCLTPEGMAQWNRFNDSTVGRMLQQRGVLIPTWIPASLPDALHAESVVEHEKVKVISYSHEWSFTTLREAALLHLELMSALVPAGWWLKDADPANVQWYGGRMVLIDTASIEPMREGPWPGLGQFCETMLFPLMLSSYLEMPHSAFLSGVAGARIDVHSTARLLGWGRIFKPGVALEVLLQSLLQNWFSDLDLSRESGINKSVKMAEQSLVRMLARMKRLLERLPPPKFGGWTDYAAQEGYDQEARLHKAQLVESWLAEMSRPSLLCDLGANTGFYARLAQKYAQMVVATDADAGCVNAIAASGLSQTLALLSDFTAPSPSMGWRLTERPAFWERVKPEVSIALALIHHVCLGKLIPLDQAVETLLATSPVLILEFVGSEDPMGKMLLQRRGVPRPDYTEENLVATVSRLGRRVVHLDRITPNRGLFLIR